jgi:N utilization substance protein A
VSRVLLDDQNKAMEIIVPDDQLSLAIGRRGQNVRLAAQLTGWKLDINSESRVKELREFAARSLTALGLNEATVELLYAHGFRSAKDFANASTEVLLQMPGISPENVERYLELARGQIGKDEEEMARLDREREEARAAEARRHPSDLTQTERLLRVRGISDRNIEQMANAGYKTVEDIHNEPDVVKLGETTGLGVKKAKQVKAAVEHYLQEEARLKADLDAQRAAAAPPSVPA